MKPCVAYLRVSTAGQEEGYGLDAQRAAIEAWARETDHQVTDWVEETASGAATLEDRRGLLEALRKTWAVKTLVVARVDRWTREPTETAILDRLFRAQGARLLFVQGPTEDPSTNPMARLINDILQLFARYDRLQIQTRLSAGKERAAAEGLCMGEAPFGYRNVGDGRLEVEPAEARVVRWVLANAKLGLGAVRISNLAHKHGMNGREGRPLGQSTVAKVIARRTFYEGKVNKTGGDRVTHEALVTT